MAVTVADLQAKISANTSDAEAKISSFGSNLGKLGGAAGSVASSLAKFGSVATGAVAAGLGAAVGKAAQFEAVMSSVGAVSGATGDSFNQLRQLAIQMGADTAFSAKEAAQAMDELARGGISVDDILGGALSGTLALAAAGGLDLAEAATIASDAMNIFGLSGDQMSIVADSMAAAANASSIDVQDLAQSMKYAGPVAAQMGFSLQDVNGALAALGANGLKGSEAGTGLRTMLISLAAPSKDAAKLMANLGLEFFDSSGHMKSMQGIADELVGKLGGMADAQRIATMETLFGKEGMSAAVAVMKQGGGAMDEWISKVSQQGIAQSVAAQKMDNLRGSWEEFTGSIETGAIMVGSALTPALKRATEAITGFLNQAMNSKQAQAALEQFGRQATAAVDAVIKKVSDPAFQQQMKEWGLAALEVGRAVGSLATTIASQLGPPLQAAVSWFNGLDAAGKRNVISFGLVAASAIKFRDELGTLKTVVMDVVGAFAAKRAAKEALTASNTTLANSVNKTGQAFSNLPGPIKAVLFGMGELAIASAVAVAGAAGIVYTSGAVATALGTQADINKQNAAAWDSTTVAMQHGATMMNGHLDGFLRFVQLNRLQIESLTQAESAWNRYVAQQEAGRLSTEGLTTAMLGTAGVMPELNSRLGEGAIAGAQFNNTLVGIGVGAQAVAGTIPTLSSGLSGAANAMGVVADRSVAMGAGLSGAANALGNVSAATANAANSSRNFAGQLSGAGLAVGAFASAVGNAQGAVTSYEATLQGLGTQHGVLSGYLRTLQSEWDSVTAAVAQQGFATAAQQASINQLAPAIEYLNASLGVNQTSTTNATLAAVQNMQATDNAKQAASAYGVTLAGTSAGQKVATVIAEGHSRAIHGVSDLFGIGAGEAARYTAALTDIPKEVFTTVDAPGLLAMTDGVQGYIGTLSGIPSYISTTIETIYVTSGSLPPGRASGGPVSAMQAYVVGEVGPELFVPNVAGTIIPNHHLASFGEVSAPTAVMPSVPLSVRSSQPATTTYNVKIEGPVYGFENFEDKVVESLERARARGRST